METHANLDHAAVVTYAGAACTWALCHLHLSDVAIIVSTTATLCGVACQIVVAVTKVRYMRRLKSGDK